jgi:hypothetical protein
MDRRTFLVRGSRTGLGLAFAGPAAALLSACGTGEQPAAPVAAPAVAPTSPVATVSPLPSRTAPSAGAIIDDVLDFALASEEWEGPFGFVQMRLHQGRVDGNDVFFVRTDASDEAYAEQEGLVYVPKLKPLVGDGLSLPMYVFDDHPSLLAAEPGMAGYTPAWRVHRARFTAAPRELDSVAAVEEAVEAGEVEVEQTDTIVNATVVKWSSGELSVDPELKAYFPGVLIEPPDTAGMSVMFKLNQCYPGSWYFVNEHSFGGAADMTQTVLAPGLQGGPTAAGATGRTNVFMNGIEGPGPMGFQPSAFDFPAGHEEWSPYWDHYAYRWVDGVEPRLLTSEADVHGARDAGELEEFAGLPDTNGEVFTVNCPVPVLGANTFEA